MTLRDADDANSGQRHGIRLNGRCGVIGTPSGTSPGDTISVGGESIIDIFQVQNEGCSAGLRTGLTQAVT